MHTQARDVRSILKATEGSEVGKKYVLDSVRGLTYSRRPRMSGLWQFCGLFST